MGGVRGKEGGRGGGEEEEVGPVERWRASAPDRPVERAMAKEFQLSLP